MSDFFKKKRVLVTGHCGFKGSWLCSILSFLGAKIYGYSLDSRSSLIYPSLVEHNTFDAEQIADINDFATLNAFVQEIKPDYVFHLAAQPLVIDSYKMPIETFSTNVIGTVNLLEAIRLAGCVQACVIITTDKCYENLGWHWPYRESDRLGGHDPYSASKAAAELAVSSYNKSFFCGVNSTKVATARAGNVIGGGDNSKNRLLPDIAEALRTDCNLAIRSPSSTRPWQHVLDPLIGYLLLAKALVNGKNISQSYNFGPSTEGVHSVSEIIDLAQQIYPRLNVTTNKSEYHEAKLLALDSSLAMTLGWQPKLKTSEAVELTLKWYQYYYEGISPKELVDNEIKAILKQYDYTI